MDGSSGIKVGSYNWFYRENRLEDIRQIFASCDVVIFQRFPKNLAASFGGHYTENFHGRGLLSIVDARVVEKTLDHNDGVVPDGSQGKFLHLFEYDGIRFINSLPSYDHAGFYDQVESVFGMIDATGVAVGDFHRHDGDYEALYRDYAIENHMGTRATFNTEDGTRHGLDKILCRRGAFEVSDIEVHEDFRRDAQARHYPFTFHIAPSVGGSLERG